MASSRQRARIVYFLRSLHTGLAVLLPAVTALLVGVTVGLLTCSRRRGRNVLTWFLGRFASLLAGMRIDVRGLAHAQQRPAIFVFNHQSGLDPIIVCRIAERDLIGIAKKELQHNPIIGPMLWFAETIFIDRFEQQQKRTAVQPALDALALGLSIAIAPEGTRQSDQPLGEFRTGGFRLAIEAQVPVVPIIIYDSARLLGARRTDLRPGTVHVEVLEPIATTTGNDEWRTDDPASLAHYVHRLMQERLCRFNAS